ETALEYLRETGVDWSLHPTNEEVQREYQRIWQQLGNRPIEALVDLPSMTDPLRRATLDLLAVTEGPAFFHDQNLRSLIVTRMVNLSLEYGNSDGSCVAYLQLGWFVGPRFGDHQAAFRFGMLGLELTENRGLERFKPRVYQIFSYFISPWTRPLRASLESLRRSFRLARETGDIKYAAYGCDRLTTLLLAVGEPLDDVQREAESGLEFARTTKFNYVADIIIGQLRLIRLLRGLTPSFSSFNDADFDQNRFEQYLEADSRLRFATCWYWIRKLQAHFLAGDYTAALLAAAKAEPLLQRAPGHFEWAEYIFYSSLARAAGYSTASPEDQVRSRETLSADHRQLFLWAENCPENFENRAALIEAEIARIEGRELDAQRLYEQAIRSARDNGFAQNEGIANEVAARFYAERGFETTAHAYVRNARHCYLRWGANGKVRQLDELHPFLRGELAQSRPATTIAAPVEHLDVAAIIKVSQATSGEIVLDKLITTIMRTALEQAGAERGLLILGPGVEQRIEAEARSDRDKVLIDFRQTLISPSELPESLLRYVVRTQESVILSDASTQNIFSDDEYLRQRRPRSVLCLPLLKQRKLLGVLYFENNLARGVFTPDRLAMLELIASQAAISLEQARLYAELTHTNEELQAEIRERRRAEEALRRSDAYLSEAQRLSRTGSFGWDVASGKMYWSQETFRIFGYEPTIGPTLARVLHRTHPGDRAKTQKVFDQVSNEQQGFDLEHRLLMPDGAVKYVRVVGRPSTADEAGSFEFVGAITDITDRKQAEEELHRKEVSLREAQTELAHVSRVTTMGELAASIAHEVNQPLAGIVTNANAGLRWLANESANLDETRQAIRRIIRDGSRAGEIIGRIRDLAKKTPPHKARLDLNETIGEVIAIARSELQRNHVSLGVQLAEDLPLILGDRIQLQQVILNLLINAIEAMNRMAEGFRELQVTSETVGELPGRIGEDRLEDEARMEAEPTYVLIAVRDSGPGLD
ncbi:MAG: GAF domain-containing protein, partial [Verrucomicrobia bacterium]|nr:GAF domain-containing protein [Verrucomicrobiota bacterium]